MRRENHVVIMAGGIGGRIWPLSSREYPKQFIDVMGVGQSLLQLTVSRFSSICSIQHIWIVTSEDYVSIVKEQLPNLPVDNILAEPEARNTAPCIGYACWKINKKYPHANIVVVPSDAFIQDTSTFQRVIKEALSFTESSSSIVTIGIRPTRPETGYGYIEIADKIENLKIAKVVSFKEKPEQSLAVQYIKSGMFLWNAGIFVWNSETIIRAFRRYAPQLAGIMDLIAVDFYTEHERETLGRLFPTCEKISIDYAVMEKSSEIYTIAADFGWSDVGTWGSLHSLLPKDPLSNSIVGKNVRLHNCSGCVVYTGSERQMVLEGLSEYIVAEHNGKFIVCPLSKEQQIKDLIVD